MSEKNKKKKKNAFKLLQKAEEKKYKCLICNKRFIRKSEVTKHCVNAHGEIKFEKAKTKKTSKKIKPIKKKKKKISVKKTVQKKQKKSTKGQLKPRTTGVQRLKALDAKKKTLRLLKI